MLAYSIKNKHSKNSIIFGVFSILMLIPIVLPFISGSRLEGFWVITILSIFAFILFVSLTIALALRAKKMTKLLSGKNLLASWRLNDEEKEAYINNLFLSEKTKNKLIFFILLLIMTLVFALFIILMKDARILMFLLYLAIMAILAIFAFTMPYYYRYRNRKGDCWVLIGEKYVYINGFFHNWDFCGSGLVKAKVIQKPFYGIQLCYYYYGRTKFKAIRSEEILEIPANKDIDLQQILQNLKA